MKMNHTDLKFNIHMSGLSKQFIQFPFTLVQYLNKSLQSKKNSSAFPDFKLIEATSANNSISLAGFPAYEIVWTTNIQHTE